MPACERYALMADIERGAAAAEQLMRDGRPRTTDDVARALRLERPLAAAAMKKLVLQRRVSPSRGAGLTVWILPA